MNFQTVLYGRNDAVSALPCSHIFHEDTPCCFNGRCSSYFQVTVDMFEDCISRWLLERCSSCPLCNDCIKMLESQRGGADSADSADVDVMFPFSQLVAIRCPAKPERHRDTLRFHWHWLRKSTECLGAKPLRS